MALRYKFNVFTGRFDQVDDTDTVAVWGSITGTLSAQTDLQTALDLKATLASPTFTGTVVLPSTTSIGSVSATEIGYLDGVTSGIQTQLNAKAATLSGTANEIAYFNTTSTIASLTVATYPSLTELSYIKGVTSAVQTQLDAKQPLDSDLTTIAGLTATTDNFIVSVSSAWASRTPAQVRTTLALVIGTDVQAYDADLTTWAGITPGTGVGTALAVNVGSAGAFVTFNGALGTPSSGTGTNITGIPAANILAGSFGAGAYVISTSLQVTTIELNHASANTLSASGGILSIESVAIPTISSSDTLSNKTLTAPIINAATMTGNFNYSAVPATDHTANGRTISAFNLGATIAIMDLVYLGSSSKWLLTDADAASTSGGVLIGICLDGGVDTDTTTVVLDGLVRDDTWAWTPGAPLYIDTVTPGQLTATKPSGTDDVVRVVGFAVTADVIWLNPSPDYITIV